MCGQKGREGHDDPQIQPHSLKCSASHHWQAGGGNQTVKGFVVPRGNCSITHASTALTELLLELERQEPPSCHPQVAYNAQGVEAQNQTGGERQDRGMSARQGTPLGHTGWGTSQTGGSQALKRRRLRGAHVCVCVHVCVHV